MKCKTCGMELLPLRAIAGLTECFECETERLETEDEPTERTETELLTNESGAQFLYFPKGFRN